MQDADAGERKLAGETRALHSHITKLEQVSRDASERKRVEEKLRQSEEFNLSLLESSPNPIIVINPDTSIRYVNEALREITGLSNKELIGEKSPYPYWTEETLEKTDRDFKEALDKGAVKVEELFKTKKGERFWVQITSVAVKENAKLKYYLANWTDITDQKRAQEALRESEEKYRGLVENSPNLVAIYQDDTLKYVNKTMCEKLGWTFQEITSPSFNPVEKIIPQRFQSLVKGNIAKRLRRENVPPYELSIKTRDGSEIPVIVKAQAILYCGKPADEVIHIDVTERKQAEQKLLEDQAQLKSLASQLTLAEERERHRLATELHDRISQALVVSKIKLDALRKSGRSRKLDKALEDVCNSIGQTIQDTRALTFDLGSPVLHELGFETAVSEWLTDQIQKKYGITVEFEDDGEPKPLDDDVRILLFRDVRELLTNVAKHASAHKVKVSIRKVGSEIHISVEDDGWGFDTKKVAATAVREGGFGLFSIRERLGQLGGHLEIESGPGCGTKATLMAPLKQEKVNRKGEK